MSTLATATDPSGSSHAGAVNRLIKVCALGLGVLLSGYVLSEPAPYEIYMSAMIAIWALFGLRLSRTNAPLLMILLLFIVGGIVSMSQLAELKDAPLYIGVALFLAMTAVFYAAIIEQDMTLLPVIYSAYIYAALFTSVLGFAGYFHLFPGADYFTLYDRARGGFKDPNVFGPFLMLPVAWLLYGVLRGKVAMIPLRLLGLLIISLGAFLSFSRAAWGLEVMVLLLVSVFSFMSSDSNRIRLRIIALAGAVFVIVALALIIALQFPAISDLFADRAKLVQSYDGARLGRFARYALGLQVAIEHPLGIGPLIFPTLFGEDTHNIWLKAALDYSWLGFVAYVLLTVMTLGIGAKILMRDRPWQPFLICAYSVYIGHVIIANIISTDHWRHFYLLVGIIWGCYGLEHRYNLLRKKPATAVVGNF